MNGFEVVVRTECDHFQLIHDRLKLLLRMHQLQVFFRTFAAQDFGKTAIRTWGKLIIVTQLRIYYNRNRSLVLL